MTTRRAVVAMLRRSSSPIERVGAVAVIASIASRARLASRLVSSMLSVLLIARKTRAGRPHGHHPERMNRYPCPRTVSIRAGSCESVSTFARSFEMWTSHVLPLPTWALFHSASMIAARLTTRPG